MPCDHLLIKSTTNEPVEKFLNAMDIFVNNQNALNKKLAGSQRTFYRVSNVASGEFFELLQAQLATDKATDCDELMKWMMQQKFDVCQTNEDSLEEVSLVVNTLIPKKTDYGPQTKILCIADTCHADPSLSMLNLSGNLSKNLAPEFPYQLRYCPKSTELSVFIPQHKEHPFDPKSIVFLKSILFPKLQKWMANPIVPKTDSVRSLQLINIEDYNQLYADLKTKYGPPMVEIWPEKTDPQKFVYEDIAIAAYLLTFWRQERDRLNNDRLQSFVDLGCGNGLLVHILASEGHKGYGIDLRKRGIWDMYPATTKLILESIVPSNLSLFPAIDYIIGNHSDELSPWIPVIAARSSYATKFFLLPCCAFDFDGAKYQRKSCAKSQYNDFLDYVQEISVVCGYRTSVDRLKIPSTKRICVIGDARTYAEDRFEEHGEAIQAFIDSRCRRESQSSSTDVWSENFKPRESVEKVRNCTQVEKSVVSRIVGLVFDQLIVKKRTAPEFHPTWNCGGAATLSELVRAIPSELLKQLKAECGGLQTLLKNNHQIFDIQKGTVRLRLPKKLDAKRREFESKLITKEFIFKQKECWFLAHHPDGCPFMAADCSYKH